MSNFLQMLWNMVTSRNLAIVLLIAVTLMLAIGAFLPNPDFLTPEQLLEMHLSHPVLKWLGERFNSQTLARSKFFGFVGIFLILSTTLCSVDRLITKKKARAGTVFSFPSSTSQEGEKRYYETINVAGLEELGRAWFRKQRWNVAVQEDATGKIIVGSRGHAGFWGSIFFHFILITSLFGLVIYYFGSYRATLGFTEGQSYRLEKERLVHVLDEPAWGLRLPDAEVGLVKQYSLYAQSDPLYPVEHAAVFKVTDLKKGNSWEKTVRINDPLLIDGRKFLLQRGGFSPRVIMKDSTGKVIFDAFVALRNKRGTEDDLSVREENIQIKLNFYPDLVKEGDLYSTKSLEVKNPFYMLSVFRDDTSLFKGLVPLNSEAEAAGYRIIFPEVRRWVELEMVGEPGIGFFFTTSFVGLFGVFVRIIDPDERIYIILKDAKRGAEMTSYIYSKHFSGLIEDRRAEMVSYIGEMVNKKQEIEDRQ